MKHMTVIAGAMLLACAAGGTAAAEVDALTKARAERLAIGVCGTCHGPRGNSEQPKYPRLAGQSANYLAAQLHAFKTQTRGDPDAIGYMWGMAANLDDPVIDALAAYYAAQSPRTGRASAAATMSRGKEIFTQGIESASVPACATCHGPDAHGLADFPRLAGQHAQYILKQLKSFHSNLRDVAVMHGVAQGLKTTEMQAVAAFLQAQP
jgi:cytochrome c553